MIDKLKSKIPSLKVFSSKPFDLRSFYEEVGKQGWRDLQEEVINGKTYVALSRRSKDSEREASIRCDGELVNKNVWYSGNPVTPIFYKAGEELLYLVNGKDESGTKCPSVVVGNKNIGILNGFPEDIRINQDTGKYIILIDGTVHKYGTRLVNMNGDEFILDKSRIPENDRRMLSYSSGYLLTSENNEHFCYILANDTPDGVDKSLAYYKTDKFAFKKSILDAYQSWFLSNDGDLFSIDSLPGTKDKVVFTLNGEEIGSFQEINLTKSQSLTQVDDNRFGKATFLGEFYVEGIKDKKMPAKVLANANGTLFFDTAESEHEYFFLKKGDKNIHSINIKDLSTGKIIIDDKTYVKALLPHELF